MIAFTITTFDRKHQIVIVSADTLPTDERLLILYILYSIYL